MRFTAVLGFQQTTVRSLTRPWKKYKDGTLFYGVTKTGSKRHALTTKDGNKNFYKGTRSNGIGRLDRFGRFRFNWAKVRHFVVPRYYNPKLLPFVSQRAPELKNSYKGFKGPTDPKLFYTKLKEFIFHGRVVTKEAERKGGYLERG